MTTDPSRDFDFHFGSWHAHHRRLKERLANCTEWEEFDGSATAGPLLDGSANMDDNVFNAPRGVYRGVTLRAFNPETKTWAIWWLDGRFPHTLDPPMIGSFEGGVGTFFSEETFNGKPIKVSIPVAGHHAHVSPVGAGLFNRRWQDLGDELGHAFHQEVSRPLLP